MKKSPVIIDSKSSVIDKFSGLPIGHVNAAGDSFKMLVESYTRYKETVQIETTKRAAISAWRDTKLKELSNQKEILELYLKETFKERAKNIEGFFAALDKGIENGNDQVIQQSLQAIIHIANQSPLAQATQLITAMKDPNIKEIEI